jgi:Holliday junction resolvase RusA-like endonuclease
LLQSKYKGKPLEGPLSVICDIHLRRAKSNKDLWPSGNRSGDCDNYAKAILDAANSILYVDDCQICSLLIRKVWADGGEPRIILLIDRLD